MFLRFDEKGPLGFVDDRVFAELEPAQAVREVWVRRRGTDLWATVEGLEAGGAKTPALACKVQDSGEGACMLVFGGAWGLELTDPASGESWHEPFLLLPPGGKELR